MDPTSQKKIILIILAVIVLLGGGFYFLIRGGQIPSSVTNIIKKDDGEYKPLPPPPPQEGERQFEIVSISEGGSYLARDTKSQEEFDIFIPTDAQFTTTSFKSIRKGFIVTAKKWMEFSNGLVITQLSVSD